MQDRYTGDIGDFGKLGLLRILQSRSLTIGVNWYLTPDEDHNDDGKHTKYLKDESYRKYDEALWLELNQIVDAKQRRVFKTIVYCRQSFMMKFLISQGRKKQKEC